MEGFSTITSIGRLTLNVLLSFAQFEREVTGERIRDKIAASKAKGMWMGGAVPLGYHCKDRKLIARPEEAEMVRDIYRRYLVVGNVRGLRDQLHEAGMRSRRGNRLRRSTVYRLLRNRVYLGEIPHKGKWHA